MKEPAKERLSRRGTYVLLCLSVIGFLAVLISPCPGPGKACAETAFSVTSTDEPLRSVLQRISRQTGYRIEISREWETKLLTVRLDNLPLEKGLQEIMRMIGGPSYAIVRNDGEKRIDINIVDSSFGTPRDARKTVVPFPQRQTAPTLTQVTPRREDRRDTRAEAGAQNHLPDLVGPAEKEMPPIREKERQIAERAAMEREIAKEIERIQRERPKIVIVPPPP